MHRHHISYKLNWVVPVPHGLHFFIHVPCSLFMSGTAWWTGKNFRGCVYYQNRRAKALGLRWLLGYPNPIQALINLFAWCYWGNGLWWLLGIGGAIAFARISG